MNFGVNLKKLLLASGDYLIFEIALICTLILRTGTLTEATWNTHAIPFSLLNALWILSFYISGLYDLTLARDHMRFFRTFLDGMFANIAIALAFFYLIPIFGIEPRTNLVLYFVLALLLCYTWRLLFYKRISPSIFRNRVLFVGTATDATRIHDVLAKSGLGFELAAVAETAPGTRFENGQISWHVNIDHIDQILKERHINTIVLGQKPDDIPGLRDALYKTLFAPVALLDRASLEEAITGRIPLEYVSQTWFLEHLREGDKAWYEGLKRIVDFCIAIPFSFLMITLFPILAVAIKFTSKGSILYSQERLGRGGSIFRIYKLRTMREDAELLGKPQFATKNDPRLTPIGGFLRKTRLDELPQIWNVLRGEMSFVGPRPERPEFVEELTRQMPFYALRHLSRPGLTGWAQVNFGYAGNFEDNLKKLQFDLYYIKHRSPLLDIAILLKTIGIVIRRQGT